MIIQKIKLKIINWKIERALKKYRKNLIKIVRMNNKKFLKGE